MRKIIKILYPYVLPVILGIFLLFSFKVLKLEYQFGYQSAHVYQTNFSWPKQIFFSELKKFKNKIFDKTYQTNFPRVNIFVSEQNSRKLLSNLPQSTKDWVEAYINYPNKKINFQEIRLRFRGDNPINWLNQKKELRIKTRRNELIDGYRYYDYKIFKARKYLPYFISENMGLITQKYKLVELYVNGESNGLYIEQERIDETFLRKNKLMPTNIYKGENHATEYHIGLNRNLFNNPNIWSKLAIFNQENPNSTKDLKKFLKTLKSNKYYSDPSLNDYIDIDYFSKFDALLTITNNIHHDFFHNMRLILDPWNGKITQLIVDPGMDSRDDFDLDFSSNDLNTFLNKNTNYIHKKYQWIYHYLFENDVIEKVELHIEKIREDLITAQKKEPYDVRGKDHHQEMKRILSMLSKNKNKLLKILNDNPESSWNKNLKNFDVSVNGYTPLFNLKIKFPDDLMPEWVGVDVNYNNIIEENEPKFFVDQEINRFKIPLAFYSNRFKQNNNLSTKFHNFKINHSNTYFRMIANNGAVPTQIESLNFFSKKNFILQEKKFKSAVKANVSNNIVNLEVNKIPKTISLNGTILVDKNLIFENEVKILPGTKFLIKPNKHIVFKRKVSAEGTKELPIIFKKNQKGDKPWGTVAIIGKGSKESILDNVIFQGGSGGNLNQYKFLSMLSIHNSSDIKLSNSKFSFNELFDDTIHIIYSSNILLKNIEIKNAYSDAIDIDISSNVILKNVKIKDSKNDGVDFMETKAIIENLEVVNSQDKGVSIGENSDVIIKNSIFKNNKIGAAIKDSSKGKFFDVIFSNNEIQLASYAKNWRYGNGGNAQVFDSLIESEENKFVTTMDPEDFNKKKDTNLIQNSKIEIFNTKIKGRKKIIGKNFSQNKN